MSNIQDRIEMLKTEIMVESVLLGICILGLFSYILVIGFVYRKIGFTNGLMWSIIVNIGLTIIGKYYSNATILILSNDSTSFLL